MRNLLKFSFITFLTITVLVSCNKVTKVKSSLTGWNFNDPKYGNYIKGKTFEGQKVPAGMVVIEGGSYTMGQVQDDVMFDWNTSPKTMHVRSFYMDETEVTNSEYFLYLQNLRDIFPPTEEQYKHIYNAALPDTLVWRKGLGNTDLLSESYLRHPAYDNYPVVGVNWLQANQYCSWRTNAINLRILIERGHVTNILANDTIRNYFDTDVFLLDAIKLFEGDSTIYKKGVPISKTKNSVAKNSFKGDGRPITNSDGILIQKFRLPTEAEWEYAAKANIGNREYNTIRGRNKYAWSEKYTRDQSKRYRGDQLANFKQGKGDYSGIAGWSSDGAAITIAVKSYPPNAFGLYDMSGNVAEWVADVYRPIIDDNANDFNYFRGNVFKKKAIGKDGRIIIVGSEEDTESIYDTLQNGKIVNKQLPGSVKYESITKEDTFMINNYNAGNNSDLNDGSKNSSRFYQEEGDVTSAMYNSPVRQEEERDSITGKVTRSYDSKRRTTLISDNTRVYKGGSWRDREYWLDPAQRRYMLEYMSTDYIGFRCASDIVGSISSRKTPKHIRR